MTILSEKQKARLIAEYANGGISQAALAKKYQVSERTVCNIIHAQNKDFSEKLRKIKKDAEKDAEQYVRDFIEERTKSVCEVAGKALDHISSKINNASVRDAAGVFKICYEAMVDMVNASKRSETQTEYKKDLEDYVAALKEHVGSGDE